MSRSRARRRRRGSAPRRRRFNWRSWLGWGAVALVIAGAAALVIRGPGQSVEDPSIAALAEASSGGPVTALRGSAHTVYHSTLPLPTAAVPRPDGKPTLVWFSGTWCEVCRRMEPFVYPAVRPYADRLVFVEKSVDHDRAAAVRYGVRGTPTFVLVDATGDEVARFYYQPSAASFVQSIEGALAGQQARAVDPGDQTPLSR